MILEEHSKIKGLVLAGGKSVRMGQDKGMTQWHGQPQRYYMADMLATICDEVFISCREDQVAGIDTRYIPLTDNPNYAGSGPTAAILSAFEKHPDCTWLVVACDLPLLNKDTLQFLIDNRNTSGIATTFKSPHDGLPEPLITIWEPSSYPILLAKLQEGYKCPRKVLINNPATILDPPYPQALMNANTPEDATIVQKIIEQQTT